MTPVKRALLVDDTAAHLRRQIGAGAFSGELPSCRQLARSLQVSVPTVLLALERLTDEGLLLRGKSRRPYQLAAQPGKPSKVDQRRRLILVISAKPLGEFEANSRAAVDRVMSDCMQHGWEFQHRLIPYSDARRSSPRWDEMLDDIRPSMLVALAGNKVLAEWAVRRGVPTLFVGGVPGEHAVTAIGVSLRDRLEVAIDSLLRLGHRHICLPICGLQEYFIQAMRQQLEEALAARGIPFVPMYHAPGTPHRSPTAMVSLLGKVFAARVPTAIILVEWIDFVSASALLAKHGLAFGKDVVGVVLTYEPHLEWFQPRPAHFRLPLQRLQRTLSEWLKNPNAPRFRKGGLMLQPCRFYEGDAFRGPAA
ncbi:GntR family transcriptional regulator [Luteolibacter sp. LG18]|uniref:GntR family transcriptional regulator n=1 Tax=Luteolibacter sp. LG18 TaxID=2819286 RepID=UPI002B323AD2|nr:hypothetical protein llg_13180 [Luteolibacter sp. LG18]